MKKIISLFIISLMVCSCDDQSDQTPTDNGKTPNQVTNNPNDQHNQNTDIPQNKGECDCTVGDDACINKCVRAICKCSSDSELLNCVEACQNQNIANCQVLSIDDSNFNPLDPSTWNITVSIEVTSQEQITCLQNVLNGSSQPNPDEQQCSSNDQCASNYCNPNTNKCDNAPETGKKSNGEQCSSNNQCTSNYCNPNTDTCDNAPETGKKSNGEQCSSNDQCTSNYCNPNTDTCDNAPETGKKSNGEQCSSYDQCASNYCDPDTNTCDTYHNGGVKPGGSCSKHSDCESRLCLDSGRCGIVINSSTNEISCTSDSDCESKGVNLHCNTFLRLCTLNDPCEGISCTTGYCYMGQCITNKTLPDNTPCDDNSDFCSPVNHDAYHCEGGVYHRTRCTDAGLSLCSIYVESGNRRVAKCTRGIINSCHNLIVNHNTSVNVCTRDESGYYPSECIEDVNGWLLAFPQGNKVSCSGLNCSLSGDAVNTCH